MFERSVIKKEVLFIGISLLCFLALLYILLPTDDPSYGPLGQMGIVLLCVFVPIALYGNARLSGQKLFVKDFISKTTFWLAAAFFISHFAGFNFGVLSEALDFLSELNYLLALLILCFGSYVYLPRLMLISASLKLKKPKSKKEEKSKEGKAEKAQESSFVENAQIFQSVSSFEPTSFADEKTAKEHEEAARLEEEAKAKSQSEELLALHTLDLNQEPDFVQQPEFEEACSSEQAYEEGLSEEEPEEEFEEEFEPEEETLEEDDCEEDNKELNITQTPLNAGVKGFKYILPDEANQDPLASSSLSDIYGKQDMPEEEVKSSEEASLEEAFKDLYQEPSSAANIGSDEIPSYASEQGSGLEGLMSFDESLNEDLEQKAKEAKEEAERERIEAQKLEAQKLEAQKLEAQKLEAQKLEAQKLEAQKLEAQRIEAQLLETERLEAERLEAEKLEQIAKEAALEAAKEVAAKEEAKREAQKALQEAADEAAAIAAQISAEQAALRAFQAKQVELDFAAQMPKELLPEGFEPPEALQPATSTKPEIVEVAKLPSGEFSSDLSSLYEPAQKLPQAQESPQAAQESPQAPQIPEESLEERERKEREAELRRQIREMEMMKQVAIEVDRERAAREKLERELEEQKKLEQERQEREREEQKERERREALAHLSEEQKAELAAKRAKEEALLAQFAQEEAREKAEQERRLAARLEAVSAQDAASLEMDTNHIQLAQKVAENEALLSELVEQGTRERPKDFMLPSAHFFQRGENDKPSIDEAVIDKKVKDLLDKLRRFKIEGDVVRIYSGPLITTFEFKPAPQVKVNSILNLQDDLAMALQAQSIRIQAPIPGKGVVGIEIPNEDMQTVYLGSTLNSPVFKSAKSELAIILGKDIVGETFVTDLKKLPHLLIAGTTGSGKSVGINAMIVSLLYKNSPKTLRLVMIDPKMLEFGIYNGIPHLLTPVITKPDKAIVALKNLVIEMERRYTMMAAAGTRVKNIEGYNEYAKEADEDELPYIVVIIDELADLMMTSGKDVEYSISRLAQMARASGIHLIAATQRPSADVITGIIRSNTPSRISYRVGNRADSKIILDGNGAESLLGKGDCLFKPPSGGIVRLHAPYASEKEIDRLVTFLREQGPAQYDESFLDEGGEGGGAASSSSEVDEKYEQAVKVIKEERKTSISYLQRRLEIGYNRAANIIEQMQNNGVLGAPNSKGVREILV